MFDFICVQNYCIACGYRFTAGKKRTPEELRMPLPVDERVVSLADDEKVNANGHALSCIGQEYIRTKLVLERDKAKVVKHYRKVYADWELEQEAGCSEVFKPAMPLPLLAHSYASASVVTDVLMKQYVDARPLHRQAQMWKRMGVELKRGAMANWVIQAADLYLRPFWKRIRSELLTQSAIHAGKTVMQVLKERRESQPLLHRACGCIHPPSGQTSSCAALNIRRAEAENGHRPSLRGSKAC